MRQFAKSLDSGRLQATEETRQEVEVELAGCEGALSPFLIGQESYPEILKAIGSGDIAQLDGAILTLRIARHKLTFEADPQGSDQRPSEPRSPGETTGASAQPWSPADHLNAKEVDSAMTLDQIVNEVHTHLEPIRTQCDLFCSKAEEYAAILEEYTREAIDGHTAEFDRRRKERERLGVELLPGESFFHSSDGRRSIDPCPQEEEFEKGPPQEGWVWTQFCDYNYIGLPDMDTFWRPPEPSHPLEWLWQSLPWWGHTTPTITRTKREWTNEEQLMCECLWLACIHDMRFATAPSRHERVFLGRPYCGRFQRDEVARALWSAMQASPRGLEDLQISWAWAKRRLNDLEQAQAAGTGGDKPRGGIPSQPAPQEPTDINTQSIEWDVFISHASEDKEAFVRPLAVALQKKNVRVWFDEFTLTVGDSLRRSIDRGLACSRHGIVVISCDFLKKDWPQKELDGLVAREIDGRKVILPVWHNIDAEILKRYSPLLADRVATSTAKGVDAVVSDLMKAMK